MDDKHEFSVNISFQGKTIIVPNVTTGTTGESLVRKSGLVELLQKGDEGSDNRRHNLKMLYKGKKVELNESIFAAVPSKTPRIIIMASSSLEISQVQSKRSDPTIRGFDQERSAPNSNTTTATNECSFWGPESSQDKNYKFCRLLACTWQSFGHRPTDDTPHAFRALELLEQLSTDPGIVAIMKERELIVGTLAEMDPIDDRYMNKKQEQNPGICVLGYNTNGGMRIDLKLRNQDLRGFRPYPLLVATLIHELSHNWVGEHNLLFWTNYGQMRAEYLHTHLRLRSFVYKGSTTAALAGLSPILLQKPSANVLDFVLEELQAAMPQYGLHPSSLESAIRQRCDELDKNQGGQRLGGETVQETGSSKNARDLAVEAAERRAAENNKSKGSKEKF